MRWKAIIMLGMCLCLSLISCDLFKTRTPQEPTELSSNRIPPTDPDKVLQNMIDSFHDKNTENYLSSLSSVSFAFEATAKAQRNFGTAFLAWDRESEQKYFSKLISQVQLNSGITLKFHIDSATVISFADSSQAEADYQLTVPLAEANSIQYFRGRSQFMFSRDQTGLWSIRQWLDIGLNASDSTWSDLKGAFAQ
jgi:hypothetical protein